MAKRQAHDAPYLDTPYATDTPMELQHYLKAFGHSSFRGRQEEIISNLIQGRHALIIMPTGMGKSLCYQIPALASQGLTLVISPLIALMKDQVDGLIKKGISATFINSSLSKKERKKRYSDLKQGRFKLLYVTPERFRKEEFLDCLASRGISLLAVDEAHCISQWGHDFRPDYSRLKEFRALLNDPPTVALTATATPEVQDDIINQLGLIPDEVDIFLEGIERPNLHLRVEHVWDMPKKIKKISQLSQDMQGSGIVYFSLIKTLEECSNNLHRLGISHQIYHGKLDREQRRRVQDDFMDGDNQLILATNAFGMGIDKADIRFVVHAEVPGSIEGYYQEIGRAGRDGLPSECLLLYDEQDLLIQMDFIKWSNPDADLYKRVYAALADDPDYCNAYGIDGIKDSLVRNRNDFRIETVFSMLERYGVTTGSLENKNLAVQTELPARLTRQNYLQEKMLREQKMLHSLVQYANTTDCRKGLIHNYFGIPGQKQCDSCDCCSRFQ